MSLEDKINKLNHDTKSSINVVGDYVEAWDFQAECNNIYYCFLHLDDDKKLGFMDTRSYLNHTKSGTIIREVKNIVWTDHGPLIRTMQTGINTQKGVTHDKYHNISVEGYFLMPSNPSQDIPPRYEYANVVKCFQYNDNGQATTSVGGIAKIDDKFCSFSDAVAPRAITDDKAFDLLEGQVNSAISLAQPLPLMAQEQGLN